MIFQFPDSDTLRLALTSGLIPPAVSLAPAVGGADDGGRPWVEPSAKPTRGMLAALAKLGVATAKAYASPGEELANWLQALPIQKDADPPPLGGQTPVLFELADPQQLPVVVGEMMRLANDRQSFRWLKDDETGGGPILLRVVGPPYYTLLRALDREHGAKGLPVRAYVERAPRVWVEVGFTHPLIAKIEPQEGQILILRSPRDWVFVEDKPFRDIYEILDFKLPQTKLDWVGADLKKRLTVPLRLIEGDRHDPELWVLRQNAVDRLDALVRDAKESLVQRLLFAVGKRGNELTVVVRVRPSKQAPPQLVLDAAAYNRFLKLDNLFVPVGTKIHPLLRRDAVRRLLADDPARITWLQPDPEKPGGFTPECLTEDAFHPLQEWVDYVLDRDREALAAWAQEFRFDFDPFVCPEEASAGQPKPPGGQRRRPAAGPDEDRADVATKGPKVVAAKAAEVVADEPDVVAELEIKPPDQLQIERAQLEKQFLEIDGPLDHPDRLALWPEMAARNAALKHVADAALCWMNRIWEVPENDVATVRELAWRWVQAETDLTEPWLTKAGLDRQLRTDPPMPQDVRAMVAMVVWGATLPGPAAALADRLPQIQLYLQKYEAKVNVRAVWLAWHAIARLAGNDSLALARARDRLLERLITEGLSPERDLPGFLRTAGHRDADRIREVQKHVTRLYEAASKWCKKVEKTTQLYIDLTFSFGLARLGEVNACRERLAHADAALAARRKGQAAWTDEVRLVTEYLVEAYRYRIDQSLLGRPHTGPLPPDLRERLEKDMPTGSVSRYGVDRILKNSHVVEPDEKYDPYWTFTSKHIRELEKELLALKPVHDPKHLTGRIHSLYFKGVGKSEPTADEQMMVVKEALMLAPRAGEALVTELLTWSETVLDRLPAMTTDPKGLEKQAELLERALSMAANYGRPDLVQRLLSRFFALVQKAQQSVNQAKQVNAAFRQGLRGLRKLGLRDDMARLIESVARDLLGKQTVADRREEMTRQSREKDWPAVLQTLLLVADGWLFFGWVEKAAEILEEARTLLFRKEELKSNHPWFLTYCDLACTYATVLGHAPVDYALRRLEEMFQRMWDLPDSRTSARYYSELHLAVVEAVVLAIVSDDFALGPGARRWLEDDEYLIRRRLHRDHRAMVQK